MKLRPNRAPFIVGAALALGIGGGLAFAAPASATISFCQTGKNSPCIGPINGCALVLGGGNYGFAEDGDSIVNSKGEKFTCLNGKWVKQSRVGAITNIGALLGRGELQVGPPADNVCDVNQLFCPPIP